MKHMWPNSMKQCTRMVQHLASTPLRHCPLATAGTSRSDMHIYPGPSGLEGAHQR